MARRTASPRCAGQLDQALGRSGQVTAVFAWQVPFVSIPGAFDRGELEEAYREFLIKTVSEVEPSPRVPLETVLAEGDATEALVAASEDADMLVLGIRGRSPVAGLHARLGQPGLRGQRDLPGGADQAARPGLSASPGGAALPPRGRGNWRGSGLGPWFSVT